MATQWRLRLGPVEPPFCTVPGHQGTPSLGVTGATYKLTCTNRSGELHVTQHLHAAGVGCGA
jgi:hypothetical protein